MGEMETITPFAVELEGVTKKFKELVAVDNLSITIPSGQFLALLGPNGAGKTTLVEMIEGIQKPTNGKIRLFGLNWHHHQAQLHRKIGISFQETHFIDKLTARETLSLFASFYNLENKRVEEILHLVGLSEKRKSFVVNLSGGQRQRLALGVALLNSPRLLLLDEPTTGLDPSSRRELWDILVNLRHQLGITLILTTHYMEEAAFLCDQIIIMDRGKILDQGSLDHLLKKRDKGEIIEFATTSVVDPLLFGNLEGIRDCRFEKNGKTKLIVDDTVKILSRILDLLRTRNIEISSLECRKYTLDDLFVDLTGRKLQD